MSATTMLIKMMIERDLDKLFPKLDQIPAEKDVLDVLVLRDLGLRDFMDLSILLKEMGGIVEFAEYDFKVKKLA